MTNQDLHTLSFATMLAASFEAGSFWHLASVAHHVNHAPEPPGDGLRSIVGAVSGGQSYPGRDPQAWHWAAEIEIANKSYGIPYLDEVYRRLGEPAQDLDGDDDPPPITGNEELDRHAHDLWNQGVRDPDDFWAYEDEGYQPEETPPEDDDSEVCGDLTCELTMFLEDSDLARDPKNMRKIDKIKRGLLDARYDTGFYPVRKTNKRYGMLGPVSEPAAPPVSIPRLLYPHARRQYEGPNPAKKLAVNTYAFMALFTYSCSCKPTARILWEKRRPGTARWSPDAQSFVDQMTVGSGDPGQPKDLSGNCWKAVIDTPSKRAPGHSSWEFKITGKVTWNGTKPPKVCTQTKIVRVTGGKARIIEQKSLRSERKK